VAILEELKDESEDLALVLASLPGADEDGDVLAFSKEQRGLVLKVECKIAGGSGLTPASGALDCGCMAG
jgi:hypothetical protein